MAKTSALSWDNEPYTVYKFSLWRIVLIFNKDSYQQNVKKVCSFYNGLWP